jgi:hypothetical protein
MNPIFGLKMYRVRRGPPSLWKWRLDLSCHRSNYFMPRSRIALGDVLKLMKKPSPRRSTGAVHRVLTGLAMFQNHPALSLP